MNTERLKKALTLASSFILMTGFVAYRSGKLRLPEMEEPVHNANTAHAVDSPPKTRQSTDSQRMAIMSSSKSIAVFDKSVFKTDTNKKVKSVKDTTPITILPSSKLGIIYKPEDFKTPTKDSSKK
jgi:hypothetical protein